jgi:hypothetical protein
VIAGVRKRKRPQIEQGWRKQKRIAWESLQQAIREIQEHKIPVGTPVRICNDLEALRTTLEGVSLLFWRLGGDRKVRS